MNHRDIAVLMDGIAPVLRRYVEQAFEPIGARMLALEQQFKTMPAPRDGRDADPVLILRLVEEAVAKVPPAPSGKDADPSLVAELVDKAVAALPQAKAGERGPAGESVTVEQLTPLVADTVAREIEKLVLPAGPPGAPGEHGHDMTIEDMAPRIAEEVARAVSEIPLPEPGKDADPDAIAALVALEVDKAVAALPHPKDGISVTVEDLAPMVLEQVSKAVAEIPKPENGKAADSAEVERLVLEIVGKAVGALPPAKDGKDGIGVAGALIDRSGELVLTLSDGTTKSLGGVVGKDIDRDAVAEMIQGEVGKIPVPRDGVDGFGFEDMTVEHDGERGFVLRFERGELKKEFQFTIPAVIDRGVWRDGEFKMGDHVTWAGSGWIARRDTTDKPDTTDAWRLSTKRGRDGKDGKPGERGLPGPEGRPGRDLTQLGFDGGKH